MNLFQDIQLCLAGLRLSTASTPNIFFTSTYAVYIRAYIECLENVDLNKHTHIRRKTILCDTISRLWDSRLLFPRFSITETSRFCASASRFRILVILESTARGESCGFNYKVSPLLPAESQKCQFPRDRIPRIRPKILAVARYLKFPKRLFGICRADEWTRAEPRLW